MDDTYQIVVTVSTLTEGRSENKDVEELARDLDWGFTKLHENKLSKWKALKDILTHLQEHYNEKTYKMQQLYEEQQDWQSDECVCWPASWEIELVIKTVHQKKTNVIWRDDGPLVEVLEWLNEKIEAYEM